MITVTMKDNFFSGWGPAKNLVNIFMVHCNSFEEAEKIEAHAKNRSEMGAVRIRDTVVSPYYSRRLYLVTEKDYDDLGPIWKGELDE